MELLSVKYSNISVGLTLQTSCTMVLGTFLDYANSGGHKSAFTAISSVPFRYTFALMKSDEGIYSTL